MSMTGSTIYSKSGSYSTLSQKPMSSLETENKVILRRLKNYKGEGFKNRFIKEMMQFIVRHIDWHVLEISGSNRLFRILDSKA